MRPTLYFPLFFLFILSPVVTLAQNINGNNNTVIIQMQGNNNSVNNSSNNNCYNNSSSTYPNASASNVPPKYFDTPGDFFFAYYTAYLPYSFLEKQKKYFLELYKNGTFRFTTPNSVKEGTFSATTKDPSNNTFTLYTYVANAGYVKYLTLEASQGKINYNASVTLEKKIPRSEYKHGQR